MLIPLNSSLAVLVTLSSKSVWDHFHARRANSGTIMTLYGVPLFDSLAQAFVNIRLMT